MKKFKLEIGVKMSDNMNWVAPGDFEFIMQIDKPANWENTLRRI